MADKQTEERIIATNRKAFRDYEIFDKKEAGIELLGTEVKSMRAGRINISDSYATIENGQVYLVNLHISPYEASGVDSHDPYRRRRLLLHKREIRKLFRAIMEKGYTLIPLRFYFKGPYIKVELGTARGRKKYDKRDIIAKKEAQRSIERAKRRDKR